MKTFLEFVLPPDGSKEPRRKNITAAQAQQILNTKCLRTVQYIQKNNTHLMFRGISGPNDPSLKMITPSQFERTSRNTENYYTWIMDNDPIWKKFPKRSKSIVCSNSVASARNYGRLHCVIPFDGAKIATAGSNDLWNAFPIRGERDIDAADVNILISSMFKSLKIKPPTSYIEFVEACHAVDTIVKEKDPSDVISHLASFPQLSKLTRDVLNALKYDPTVEPLYRTLVRKVFFPRAGMHVGAYDDPRLWVHAAWRRLWVLAWHAPAREELWTDSDAILIPISNVAKENETFYEDFVARILRIMNTGVDSFMDTGVD